MIKKVVNKPKQKTIKKFPGFDSSKIYVLDDGNPKIIYKTINNTFMKVCLNNGDINPSEFLWKDLCTKYKVIVLNDKLQLIEFLKGRIDFPIVEEYEEKEEYAWGEDEVSIENVDKYKYIYAELSKTYGVRFFSNYNGKSILINLDSSNGGYGWTSHSSVAETINYCWSWGSEVYQFDNQEEFLKWTWEHITNKVSS